MVEARSGRHHREQKDGDSLRSSRRQQDDVAPLNGLRDDLAWLKRSASLRRWGHGRRGEMRVALVALILATWLVCVVGDCWNVALNLQDLCEDAIGNEVVVDYSKVSQAYVSAGRRRLLWHGGGAEAEDVPDHAIGDGQRYRGDGGTIHTGVGQVGDDDENAAAPGDPDTPVIESFERERRFFEFVEGRSKAGKTSIYGSEDSWWADLLQCSSTEKHLQMCESCAQHCSPWEWETSGYSLLNGTELQIEDLYWMSKNIYVTKNVLLELSVCFQYDWWICLRRLDELVVT